MAIFFGASLALACGSPAGEHPRVKLLLGRAAKTSGETAIPINPVTTFIGFTRQQIYDLRKSEVAKHPELASGGYEPDVRIFGNIEDGKPWWGLEGLYFYGGGLKSIVGGSEESRFIPNPFLLVGVRETVAVQGQAPDGSTDYYPVPTSLSWNAEDSSAHAVYRVWGHYDFTANHHFPPELANELQFVYYNANDLGFNYYWVDPSRSTGVRQEKDAAVPNKMTQMIHCGGSCGYPGGCNNMSPFGREFMYQVPSLPAKVVIKLWKGKPDDVSAPADMTYTIDLI